MRLGSPILETAPTEDIDREYARFSKVAEITSSRQFITTCIERYLKRVRRDRAIEAGS